jgi:hypothetical protein
VNMLCEDVVKGRAREAESCSREVQRNTYSIASKRTLADGKAHQCGAKPECAG